MPIEQQDKEETTFSVMSESRNCHRQRLQKPSQFRNIHVVALVATAFLLCLPSADSFQACVHHGRKSTSRQVVETKEATSTAHDVADLSTPFPSVVVPNVGRNSSFAIPDEELLLPAFFPQTTTVMEAPSEDDQEEEQPPAPARAAQDSEAARSDEEQQPTDDDDGDAKRKRIDQTAKAALLLSKKKRPSKGNASRRQPKTTSVGTRRVGSATTARNSGRSVTRLVDAARIASTTTKPANKDNNKKDNTNNPTNSIKTRQVASSRRAMIDSTVEEMIAKSSGTMGVLGEAIQQAAPRVRPRPKPGTILHKSKRSFSSYTTNSDKSLIDVRVATPGDDLDIANLRLSVFSDFTAQTRKLFCDRSCHLLATRRQRGAMCLVAVEPKRSMLLSPSGSIKRDPVVGTAEISFHEFSDTRLGQARHADRILYVTEVAVNSKFRRRGIAKLMMNSIDKVASIRKIETIYLHVDVDNKAALRLYENAGFRKLPSNNAVFYEFTRKLNLHDGATKGRRPFSHVQGLEKADLARRH